MEDSIRVNIYESDIYVKYIADKDKNITFFVLESTKTDTPTHLGGCTYLANGGIHLSLLGRYKLSIEQQQEILKTIFSIIQKYK